MSEPIIGRCLRCGQCLTSDHICADQLYPKSTSKFEELITREMNELDDRRCITLLKEAIEELKKEHAKEMMDLRNDVLPKLKQKNILHSSWVCNVCTRTQGVDISCEVKSNSPAVAPANCPYWDHTVCEWIPGKIKGKNK